jgi:cytochrome c oxidase cbb3-type subunit 3
MAARSPMSDESLIALSKDPAAVAEGKTVFLSTCAACHAQQGQGLVGPNLTDKFWIHGNAPKDLASTVINGWPEKGMPPWGKVLGEDKVRKVVAFVLTIKNTNVPGKAPQGDPKD